MPASDPNPLRTAARGLILTPMGEGVSYCERCWADVPTAFAESHEAWHASTGRPWHEFFDERELERWSAGQDLVSPRPA